MAIGTGSLWPTSDMSGIGFVFSFLVLREILAFVPLRFFEYLKNLSSYNDRFMLCTSSVTRNSYVSTRICLITSKTFLRSIPGMSSSVNMEHIKRHYYGSHPSINPFGIIPLGPDIDYSSPHDRERFST
ncbi:hypothetical protein SO802_029596 [Lithocarpus litseifolius]|uniref:Uncharacterized protein n=1 Tax=Lithocarpus litseifolius TaxID=425828 RepID=A0AAW2BW60_9ROSI